MPGGIFQETSTKVVVMKFMLIVVITMGTVGHDPKTIEMRIPQENDVVYTMCTQEMENVHKYLRNYYKRLSNYLSNSLHGKPQRFITFHKK